MALLDGLSVATLFGVGMFLVGGVVLAVSARYVWRATAVLRAAERDAVAGETPGTLVRVSGTVTASERDPLVAPFSGEECVAVRYEVEERRPSYLFCLPWYVTVHEATGAVAFAVRTPAGVVPVVEPVQTVALTSQVVSTTPASDGPPARIGDFVREHERIPDSTVWQHPPGFLAPVFRALSLGTRRYSEQRAAVGADVTVVGRVTGDGTGVDPVVVSDHSPTSTVLRMATTSAAGVLVGLVSLALGYFLVCFA